MTDHLNLSFKAENVSEAEGTFEGLLSTWDLDLGGDVIHKGAYKRTLDHWQSSGRVIPLLDSHDGFTSVENAVGKLTDAKETDEGLFTRWQTVPDDRKAEAVLKRVAGGFVDGMSIGYAPIKTRAATEEEQAKGIFRHIDEISLKEGSVVIFPMNTGARVDAGSVKAAAEALLERFDELEAKDVLDENDIAELGELYNRIGALLKSDEPADQGLAPEDERRAAHDAKLRAIRLRGLSSR